MELYLSRIAGKNFTLDFVPHLLPVNCGILETGFMCVCGRRQRLMRFIKRIRAFTKEVFVRVLEPGQQPELKNVVGTNYCDIGFAVSQDGRLVVVTSAIDNLHKGASGQAVQNMNIMCGFDEKEGLI